MSEPGVVYVTDEKDGKVASPPVALNEVAWRAFLLELRRALITQLRSVETALGMEHSIPVRRRPR